MTEQRPVTTAWCPLCGNTNWHWAGCDEGEQKRG